MSKEIKTINLKEGAFPIKMDLMIEDIDLKNIGRIKDSISGKIVISLISKDLFRCEGSINTIFILTTRPTCGTLLTIVNLSRIVTICS